MNLIDKRFCSDDEATIHLGDLLAYVLLRWKFILIFLLICAVLGCGITFFLSLPASQASPEDELAELTAELTAEQVSNVDNLFARSLAYQKYRDSLRQDFDRYVYNASHADQYILLRASYYLSSSLEGLNTLLPSTLLSAADYEALEQIVSDGGISSPRERVTITVPTASTLSLSVEEDGKEMPTESFVLVTLYGDSEQQCQDLFSVVDRALQSYVRTLRDLDPEVTLQAVRQDYYPLSQSFIYQEISKTMTLVNNVETQITNLKNQVSKLSAGEQTYFDLLVEDVNATAVENAPSRIKWTVIGAFLGAVLGVGILLLQYLFDGKEKTPEEAELLFQTSTLQRVCYPEKKNLFGKWATRLAGTNTVSPEVKVRFLSTELRLLLEKSGSQKLYLLCDSADLIAARFARELKTQVQKTGSLELSVGDPLSAVADLEAFTQSHCVVVCSELKHSRRELLTQWRDLCVRYEKPIAGAVAVEKCW